MSRPPTSSFPRAQGSCRCPPSESPPLDGVSALLERISELRLHEIDDLQQPRRARAGPVRSDHDLALLLFAEEAEGLLNVSRDHRLKRHDREDLLGRLLEMEETARYDRACALALSEGRSLPPRPPPRLRKRGKGDANGMCSGARRSPHYVQGAQETTDAEDVWATYSREDADASQEFDWASDVSEYDSDSSGGASEDEPGYEGEDEHEDEDKDGELSRYDDFRSDASHVPKEGDEFLEAPPEYELGPSDGGFDPIPPALSDHSEPPASQLGDDHPHKECTISGTVLAMAGAGCIVPHSAAKQEREDVVDDDDDDEGSEAEGEESEKDSEVEQGEVEQSEVEQISQSEWEDDKVDGPAEEYDQAADFGNYFEEGGSEPTENEDALSSYVPEEPESLPGLTPDDELERSAEVAAYQDECAPDPSPSPLELCVICGDVISSTLIRLDCAHAMDPACLRAMFENAISAKALFEPPRCCHIPVELSAVGEHLYPGLVDLFEEKMREFRVPVGERVYCHSCSSFLGPHTVFTATLYCSECTHTTCSSCREWAHPGEACQEAGEGPVLDLAKAQGWQRCVSCKHLVERRDGCPHMQCICRAQFCYLCGREWGKCNSTCPR